MQELAVLLRVIGCCIEAAAVAQRKEDEVVMLSIKPTTQHCRREVCLGTIDAKVTAHTRFTAVVGAGSGTDRGWPLVDIRLRDEVIPVRISAAVDAFSVSTATGSAIGFDAIAISVSPFTRVYQTAVSSKCSEVRSLKEYLLKST